MDYRDAVKTAEDFYNETRGTVTTYRKLLKKAVKQHLTIKHSTATAIANAQRSAMICKVGTEESCRGMVKFFLYVSQDENRNRTAEFDAVYRECVAALESEQA